MNKRSYGELAYNLAVSLKASYDVPITVISDGNYQKVGGHALWVDNIVKAPRMNPFEMKVNMWELSPYEKTLYIDADSLYIGDDLNAFLQSIEKHSFLIGEYRRWKKGEVPKKYSWANMPEIWKTYRLKPDSLYPETNSSMFYFDRSKANERLFKKVKECYGSNVKLNANAGGHFPDEVAWGAGMAQARRYSNIEGWMPCYFNWHSTHKPTDYEWVSMAGKNQPRNLLNAYNARVAINSHTFKIHKYLFKPKMKLYGFI